MNVKCVFCVALISEIKTLTSYVHAANCPLLLSGFIENSD